MAATAFGLFGVVAAEFNGASFLDFKEDLSSMLTSGGLALAVTAYSLGLFAAGPRRP